MIDELPELVAFAEQLKDALPMQAVGPPPDWMPKATDFAALLLDGGKLKPELEALLSPTQRGPFLRTVQNLQKAGTMFSGGSTANEATNSLIDIIATLRSIEVPKKPEESLTVFYSWQSDSEGKVNRNFIEASLKRAIKQINKGLAVEDAPRKSDIELDKDTKGVAGSPPIVDTIFEKISSAIAFVADLTFVGRTEKDRPLPNSNVLVEYGWALSKLGTPKIIGVMNTAFGKPSWDSLPFNLRHLRWPLEYNLPEKHTPEEKAAVRDAFVAELVTAIDSIVKKKATATKVASKPFSHAVRPTWSPSAFWDLNEPFARRTDINGESVPINVRDGEHIYLRIIPSVPIGPLNPTDAVKLARDGGLEPLTNQSTGRSFGRNRFGAYTFVENKGEILMLTELHKSGELWGIDAYCIDKKIHMEFAGVTFGYIPCSAFEKVFIRTLANYLTFAERTLKIAPPLRLIAGLTRVQGFRMSVPSSHFSTGFDGDFVDNHVEYTGSIDDYGHKPTEILRPFFQHVWRECGLERPDMEIVE
jgi:hypothetical protein